MKKEIASYFNSAVAYIVAIFFLGFTAVWLFFIQQFLIRDVADLRPYFAIAPSIMVVLIPALTMRSWAEERKLGTDELLLTLPYREYELVLGKFFATLGLMIMILLLSIAVPIFVAPLGDFELGQILGQYIGLIFFSGAVISLGLFISSVSTNQISAFIISIVVLLFFTLVSQIGIILNAPRPIAFILDFLSLSRHYRSFEIGLIDTRDVVYFISFTWVFLYLNVKLLIWRKQR